MHNTIYQTQMDINTISEISGIKPHTLRIWEKRYNIIHPQRSEGGTRIYSDEDLKTILNIQLLTQYGYKISKVANLSPQERNEIIKEKLDDETSNDQYTLFINQLIKCAIDLDEINFERYFNQCIIRWGFEDTISYVIYPLLKKIGLLWEIDNISPIEEHFASQIVLQKIHEATSLLPYPVHSDQEYILFLPENNHHAIPLLFTNYLLRKNDKKTIYLGEDVPLKNLLKVSGKGRFKKAVFTTFFIFRQEKKCIKTIEHLLNNTDNDTMILVGGEINNLHALQRTFIDNTRVKTFSSIEEFKKITLNSNSEN